jgi:hypothetical protein
MGDELQITEGPGEGGLVQTGARAAIFTSAYVSTMQLQF